ncbi:GTP-binding protein yptV1-like [Scaptodrosophila lebanonensis]|uniref:GTP-binding protein yptV1-like n=1 Tax=Drosophila lebanonensis TaxID=7225 RepID=A0A6J2U0G3_DROLE|nr:GTP-binding protein yptV1-like [Scaptodrosophila lebanonensis]
MDFEYKYLFKLLMLGDAGVGKSCLLMRFADKRYTGQYICTVGIDFKVRTIEVAGQMVKLQIWDTAGEERFRSVITSYYRGAHGVFLVYDTTHRQSYRNIDVWLREIGRHTNNNINIMLVGNKCDIIGQRQVSHQGAAMYAESLGIPFMETSARSGANVEEVFISMAVNVFNRLTLPSNIHLSNHSMRRQPSKTQAKAQQALGSATAHKGTIRLSPLKKRTSSRERDLCC